jgi:hypothetical protein
MSTRLATLRKRLFDAKADANASRREIRQASATRLAELLALPDRAARLAGLKDPALTPYDRDRLEQTIADLLPRRRFRVPRSFTNTLYTGLRHARYHWRGMVLLGLISIPVTVIGRIAASNTAQWKAVFINDYGTSWRFPDGHSETITLPAKSAVIVTGRLPDGDYQLRFWSPDDGYAVTVVSPKVLDRITKSLRSE